MTLTAWALVVAGFTTIVTESKLLRPLREQFFAFTGSHFLSCPMCVGFWAGVLAAFAGLPLPSAPLEPLAPLLSGCAASWIAWTARVVLRKLGSDEL